MTPDTLTWRARITLAAEIAAAYLRVRWLLRRHSLPAVVDKLRADATHASAVVPEGLARVTGLRLGRAVSRTLAVLPGDSRCLVRSLVLTALLARRGIASSLVIGVHPGETLLAHAWVEHEGRALLSTGEAPSGEARFERLVEV